MLMSAKPKAKKQFQVKVPEPYSVVRKLGQGRFGSVYEVSKMGSDEHFAMKVLPFTSEEDYNKNEHEIRKLQNYQHNNVVGFVEVIVEGTAHFVVLELCSCSLADRMSEAEKLRTTMNRVTVFRILQDVLAGLGFLHSRNEVYGDLKPSNILIGRDGTAKLGDFGGVTGVGTQKTSNSAECGTMQFWAPEMFISEKKAVGGSQAGDMWAFGLIVLHLLTGQEWISGTNAVEIAERVKRFDVQAVCQKAKIPKSVEPLLCFLLSKNPLERLSSAELIRSGRLRSILGGETPLSQFIREELYTTKQTVGQLQAQLSESERRNKEKDAAIDALTKKLEESVEMENGLTQEEIRQILERNERIQQTENQLSEMMNQVVKEQMRIIEDKEQINKEKEKMKQGEDLLQIMMDQVQRREEAVARREAAVAGRG
ncbi:putative serine/threonine protein kinase [Blattamonas nauphoetae]|uniref:Serine/threonine protein kinase n=1 Tax=Blattamonas nauphoetae TaxID=2049346 RepID=A0ABQ9X584_9EUKA|nr:putative serine/threonine protein kinase [Blattamonas nauphoetae]